MKRKTYVLLGGLLLITAGIWILHNLTTTVIPATGDVQQKTQPFNGYPEGKARYIDFAMQYDYDIDLNKRESVDQMRDWMLYTILSDAGLSTQQMAQLTYDLPVTRAGYNENIASFDYTRTRSRVIGNGTIVALIPAGTEIEEREYIAHVADEQQKNIGTPPASLIPFTYELDTTNHRALITRGPAITGDELYTAKYGYYISKISNLGDLQTFLEHTRDLVYVKDLPDGLVLGGRMLTGDNIGNVTAEDIAALYQSEDKIKTALDGFNEKWRNKTYTTQDERIALETERDNEFKRLHLVSGSGFSLDPSYNYHELALIIREYMPLLRPYDQDNKLDAIYESAVGHDEGPFYDFLYQLKQNPDDEARSLSKRLFDDVRRHSQFQKARYDGYLQGTAVGMHLFYTDLLAKLWTMNYAESSPVSSIYGFVTDIIQDKGLSRIFERESDSFPACRLWFGPNNYGYQKVGADDRLLFARNATRIYSASSDPYQPGKEVPVSAMFAGSMNWMNGHYEEVAAYEPEYQVLNEIMKWSLVIGWLNANEMSSKLMFLTDVKVRRDHVFPEWVQQHPELRFSDWSSIKFYEPGYSGSETEAMPLLYSYYVGKQGLADISGGVSLAERETMRSLTPLSEDVNALLRRSNLDYSEASNEIKFLKGPKYDFTAGTTEGDYQIVAKAAEDTRIRGRYQELGNQDFERSIATENNAMRVEFSEKSIPIGNLDVEHVANGFKIGFQSRDVERAQSFARQASDVADPHAFITGSDHTEAYVTLEEGKDYVVKLRGSDTWTRIQLHDDPDVFLDASWDSRVAGPYTDSRICLVKFMDESEASTLAAGKNITFKSSYTTNSVANSFGAGKYDDVIGEFRKASDVGKFKTLLRDKYLEDLRELDATENEALYEMRLNDLRAAYSSTPEIRVREGLFRLQHNETDQAEELFNGAFSHGLTADDDFYAQVKQILDHTSLSDQNTQTLMAMLHFNGGGDLRLANLSLDALPAGKKLSIQDFLALTDKNKARVIVENSPGLNNIDWNVALSQGIDVNRLPPGMQILQLEETNLAAYRYELKIVPAADHSGGYEFKLSAKMNPYRGNPNSGNNKDSTDRPTYYLYMPDAANSRA